MLLNYFKITFRNLTKNKLFSVINIVGLSIGIASAILIFLFVRDERSFDRFHTDAGRIYRAYITEDPPDRDAFSYVEAPFQLGPAFKDTLPEVEEMVRLEIRSLI
ncbi:MAG: ABC transporter permease, partial [Candidatus Aminicenantes bacterium]|nr:ABC transporter permease [Candidatus Aminicenantes bacterium]